MKALILAAVFSVLSSTASASAVHETASKTDKVAVIADAGRLSGAGMATLHDGSAWNGDSAGAGRFGSLDEAFEPGQWLVVLLLGGVAMSRPLGRLLRRLEQQRRANALASTLGAQRR